MAFSALVTKVLLAAVGVGAVSAGIAIPLSKNQSSPNAKPKSSMKPLEKSFVDKFADEIAHKNCYTFFSYDSNEDNSLPLLLFCIKESTAEVSNVETEEGREAYYLWDGQALKTITGLTGGDIYGKISVSLDAGEGVKEISIDEEGDKTVSDWNFISLSNCTIKSETKNLEDNERVLSCIYDKNDEEEQEEDNSPKNIFRLKKYNFSE